MATKKTTKKSSVKKKVQPKKTKTISKKVRIKKTIKKSVSKKLVISSKNVLKVYKGTNIEVTALNKVNIDIYEGEMVAIMGPSGCGKTTLLNCLSGLDSIDSGTIKLQDMELEKLSDDKLSEFRAKNMGFVFQSFNLLPVLTTVENVELPLLVSGISPKEARKLSEAKLDDVGLLEWATHLPGELSGGQRQRVTLARALVNEPAIVWADEPTGNLDSTNELEIMDLLTDLNKRNNQTFVIVTHSDYVGGRTNRIINMKDGKVVKLMEEKVFGLPAGLLANSMIVILLAISIILLFGGLRRFILVKMGTRNIPRRKGQSTLIVMGLMLSSIIVAVSLGIGDTVRYSVRSVVFDSAGNIDETIDGPGKQLFGVEYFEYSEFENVEKLASTNINIDGVMPYIEIDLPAENDISGIAESRVQVRGYNPKYTDRFDEIKNINDEFTTIDSLGNGQVFINSALSETLNLNKGDTIGIYINLEKKEFEVNDVLKSGSIAGANITPTISFNLSALQSLLGKENMITNIAISNSGDQDKALELSDDITQFLRLNLTNKQVANKFFEILSSNEIPNLIMEEAKSIEQTDSETYEELIRIATDLEDNNFNEEFITSVGDYQLQLIILGALDKAGLQVEAAQLLMIFAYLNALRVDY